MPGLSLRVVRGMIGGPVGSTSGRCTTSKAGPMVWLSPISFDSFVQDDLGSGVICGHAPAAGILGTVSPRGTPGLMGTAGTPAPAAGTQTLTQSQAAGTQAPAAGIQTLMAMAHGIRVTEAPAAGTLNRRGAIQHVDNVFGDSSKRCGNKHFDKSIRLPEQC